MSTLTRRLGHDDDACLVIVNCDDLGMCHAGNVAIARAVTDGCATSTTLMVPCPWAAHGAATHPGPIGVHLTLTSEWDGYRWGPLTGGSTLQGPDGGFFRSPVDVWETASLAEVEAECVAQIERALGWGVDVTHLDTHMGTMQLRDAYFSLYVTLAARYGVPIRVSGRSSEATLGFAMRDPMAAAGVLGPDQLVMVPGVGSRKSFDKALAGLRPGVTELFVHPCLGSDEVRSFAPDWEAREDDLALTCSPAVRARLDELGAVLIGYDALREAQRAG